MSFPKESGMEIPLLGKIHYRIVKLGMWQQRTRDAACLKSASENALNSVFMQLRQQLSKLWQQAAANYPRVAQLGTLGGEKAKKGEKPEGVRLAGWQTLFGLLKFL